MPTMQFETTINAPATTVFEAVANLTLHGTWAANALTITPANGEQAAYPPTVGQRFVSEATVRDLVFNAELVVTAFEPDTRFGFRGEDSTGKFRHTFVIKSAENKTHITRNIDFDLSLRQWVFFMLFYFPVRRPAGNKALARLKTYCERGSIK